MSLKLYLQKLSEQVKAETYMIRQTFDNTTNKGNGFETVIRNLVRTYTPLTYNVTQGEIIDTNNHQSGQIDLLITQDFHLRGYEDGRPNLVFYDCLVALGEIKTKLTTGELATTIEASNLLNNFERHAHNNNILVSDFYGQGDGVDQKPPPFFLIALDCDVSFNTLQERINQSLITMAIILTHQTAGGGIIALGNTHRNEETDTIFSNFGAQVEVNVWTSDNPLLALIWGMNKLHVPLTNLTNMNSYYF